MTDISIAISKLIGIAASIWSLISNSRGIALRWMPQNPNNDRLTLVQVMAWCHQATSHYLNKCWSRLMLPNDVTKPRCVKRRPPTPNATSYNLRRCHDKMCYRVLSVPRCPGINVTKPNTLVTVRFHYLMEISSPRGRELDEITPCSAKLP